MRNKLKVARAQRSITQADLATALAISRQTVISIEQGRYVPSTVLALKLAHYFGQAVEELFELEATD